MKVEVIKPKKEKKTNDSILTPIIYLILGVILAFKSNQAVRLVFYILGIMVIVYGVKAFITYYKNRDNLQYKSINLSIAIFTVLIGLLLIVLAGALEVGIRYIIGFFMIFIGISRLFTDYSLGSKINLATFSNILLIVLGIFSIFVSNVILVIIGWLLILNACLLFWEFFRRN